ncbi:winged helix-turn-helix domain-containing protein [Micromonospora sp. C28SCA-DRY-2]|uniref:winged helix-turn-helix domain-containing protein n=1 Tax=Micromonospora sp. C28SCA-DRY-2 TaxID=3059522 RepID=UPI0026745A44|nr:winged helix-turn-helix domain-containing protein [Micromonospora sp. C28SCA-DRY-2]MDO3705152.1 winged helix-turn-helix domain-containing protein [Micromonospora sp. C28SCA-DRY-2]
MRGIRVASLAIGIASSPAERRQLARLLGGSEAFLIVSTVDQARKFLDVAEPPSDPPAAPPDQAVATETAPEGTAPPPPGLTVDSDRRVLRWLDREIGLTRLEHDLLRCLVGAPGRIWTYERLHREVWGNEHLGRGSDMHSVVRRVRRKLARLNAAATIHAVRGVGFRLAPV